MDTETKEIRLLAYAGGGMLSVGSAVGLGYVLGGAVAACVTAAAIGGTLLALASRSGVSELSSAEIEEIGREIDQEIEKMNREIQRGPRTFHVDGNEIQEFLDRDREGR